MYLILSALNTNTKKKPNNTKPASATKNQLVELLCKIVPQLKKIVAHRNFMLN
jgi:hypothetical protein